MKRFLTNYGSQHSQTLFNLLSTPDKRHLYHEMVQERMHRIIKLCTFADLRRPINLTDLFRFMTHDLLFLSLFPFIFKHWSTTFFILDIIEQHRVFLSLSFSFMKRRLACFPLIRSMQKQICLPHLWRNITWRTKIRTFSKWPPNWRKRKFVVNSFWPISLKFYLLKIPVAINNL